MPESCIGSSTPSAARNDTAAVGSSRRVAEPERAREGEVLEDAAAQIPERGQRGTRFDAPQSMEPAEPRDGAGSRGERKAHALTLARGVPAVNEQQSSAKAPCQGAATCAALRRSKSMAATLGITGPQRPIIRIIGRFPSIHAKQLADSLHLHPSSLTASMSQVCPGPVGPASLTAAVDLESFI